jgi:DNA invertase Pin-like site-specific DNA recombinase
MPRRRTPKTDPNLAVGYLRVSTDKQELGRDAQKLAIERWAAGAKVGIASIHVDEAVSGNTPWEKRPGLKAALEALRVTGAGHLVVYRRDRIARDILIAAMIERLVERAGAEVTSTAGEGDSSTPAGQMLRSIVNVFAQYERALISERSLTFHARLRADGKFQGSLPHGYQLSADGKHLERAEDHKYVERAAALRAEGRSLRAIAAALEAEGYVPRFQGNRSRRRTSSRLHPESVRQMLARATAVPT